MFNKALSLYQLNLGKNYLVTTEGLIYEDEYDYLESISSEYCGIKDNLEEWENQMLEENTEWKLGKEIIEEMKEGKK